MNTTETAELNRWREAGKGIGRKLGKLDERVRILKLIDREIKLSGERGAILRQNYLLEIKAIIQGETK